MEDATFNFDLKLALSFPSAPITRNVQGETTKKNYQQSAAARQTKRPALYRQSAFLLRQAANHTRIINIDMQCSRNRRQTR